MSGERLKNSVEAAYKIVLLLAVLAAAGFDVFVARKSELAQHQRNATRQVLADVELEAKAMIVAGRCNLLLIATVQNKGAREARLQLDSIPWRVALVKSQTVYQPLVKAPTQTFTKSGNHVVALSLTELVPNETATYQTLIEVPASSVVFAEFSIPVAESLIRIDPSEAPAKPWRWSARGHFPTCGVKTT